jgi:hypothetical protein
MKILSIRNACKTAVTFCVTSLTFSAFAAGEFGCESKGVLYIVEDGRFVETIAITPGDGTAAALSSQGHVGFKTDANGVFTIKFKARPLVRNETFYFRIETYGSQFLASGTGSFGNSSRAIVSPLTAQVVCAGTMPSEAAGVNFRAIIPASISSAPETPCSNAPIGPHSRCTATFLYINGYYPGTYQGSYQYMDSTGLGSLPLSIPHCSAPAPSVTPATQTIYGGRFGCFRKISGFTRSAAGDVFSAQLLEKGLGGFSPLREVFN